MTIAEKILDYIKRKGQASPRELIDNLEVSPRAIFKELRNLVDKEELAKKGSPPKVFYILVPKKKILEIAIPSSQRQLIDKEFLYVTPFGEYKQGMEGFTAWCRERNLDIEKTAKDYALTHKKYEKYRKNGFIDGYYKLKKSFSKAFLDSLFYLDFYSIERFGKTKLGQILLYAKQSQNRKIINSLIKLVDLYITRFVKTKKIDAIGFIPPTVKREIQLMKEMEKKLVPNIRRFKIEKIKTEIPIPQKSLKKLEDRIKNARNTIVVTERNSYKNILLLDDAVGSGATLNETARQIREKNLCSGKIYGIGITGSFKGFEVISEV